MSQDIILVGDKTSDGGTVISGSELDTINGRPIAREGDLVDCPGHGINPIIEGDSSMLLDAFAVPRPADALSAEAVQHQLADLHHARDATLKDLTETLLLLERLQKWCHNNLPEQAPDLHPLMRLLGLFASKSNVVMQKPAVKAHKTVQADAVAESRSPAFSQSSVHKYLNVFNEQGRTSMTQTILSSHPIDGRQAALQSIRDAREWFELAEPSSPVVVLLRQAEKMVGKRFSEVAQSIPPDLLARWEQE